MILDQAKLTIGIDARLSGKEHAGIGRYIENLLLGLLESSASKINWVFFFHHQTQADAVLQNHQLPDNVKIVMAPVRHYSFSEQTVWLKILSQAKLDLLHVPHFNIPLLYRGKIVVTIHDLLWHQQIGPEVTTLPPWKYFIKYLAYRMVTSQALSRSLAVFVPTQAVKLDLINHQPSLANKIIVTPEGISKKFLEESNKITHKKITKLSRRYSNKTLIYVGSLYPHKNIEIVFQALKEITNFQLKIVCSRDVFVKRTEKRIAQLELEKKVKFLGYLSDQELIKTIQSSFALVQPSKSEGFGLTAIEAMAVGTPVLASNLQVFKEIYQDAPLYFHPDSREQLIEAIKNLSDAHEYQKRIELGLKISQKYRWKDMADISVNTYQAVLS